MKRSSKFISAPSGLLRIRAGNGGGAAASNLLQPGQDYLVNGFNGDAETIRLTCMTIEQRNWSRVGAGLASSGATDRACEKLFIKQYVDRTGTPRPDHWSCERADVKTAQEALQGIVYVPSLRGSDELLLLSLYEYADLVSLDVLLRRDRAVFNDVFPAALARLTVVLEAMARGPANLATAKELPVKERPYGGTSRAVNFKGFDVRNVGFLLGSDGQPQAGAVAMFDFGKAYLAPIEEAAAKLFISIGLLNWGKPMRRFLKGPNFDLLSASLEPLGPYLDADALRTELHLQESFRSREPRGRNLLECTLKRIGIRTVGKRYLRQLKGWCSRQVG